ncbi:major facilitator superfamily domain-containing protein, partial [Mycena rosella]
PFNSITNAVTMAPQVELFTTLACRGKISVMEETVFASVEPGNSNSCASDPAVQASVASLITVTSTLLGILTFITCGWWGSFSDRRGRKRMIGISAISQLISAVNVLLVAKYVEQIPGGYYWVLVVDSITLGALGGKQLRVFEPGKIKCSTSLLPRSRVFSLLAGFLLVGVGIGPLLGSLIVRVTHNILSVFYLAAGFRIIQAAFVWFLLPESLSTAQMHRALIKYQAISLPTDDPTPFYLHRVFFFLKPLSVLMPDKPAYPKSLAGRERNWDLPILVLAYGLIILASSSLINQLLYAIFIFGWGSEYLGYCMSGMGITRAIYLTLILPVVIKFMKSRQSAPSVRSAESEALLSNEDPTPRAASATHNSAVDLGLARFSIVVEIATFAALPFAPTGFVFILFFIFGSLSAALSPAIHSLALDIYSRKFGKNEPMESGKLFGALSVVQCLFGQILGPPMYGLIYAATVATFPRTIFFVALGSAVVSFALLNCVRLRPAARDSEGPEDIDG